jgi:uncharacterized protein
MAPAETKPPRESPVPSEPDDVGTAFASERPPPSRPEESPRPARASILDHAAVPWIAIVVIIVVLGAAHALAWDPSRAGTLSFWLFATGPTLVVALLGALRLWRDGELAALIRPAWGDATWAILSAGVLFGAAWMTLHHLAPAGSPREAWIARIYLQLGDPAPLRKHTGLLTLGVLTAVAAEELVFRGLVTRLLEEKIGSRDAWAWAAIPYALVMVPTMWVLQDPSAGINPLLVIAALGLGLAWGGMTRITRRIFPAILSHTAFDLCVIVMFRLWGRSS